MRIKISFYWQIIFSTVRVFFYLKLFFKQVNFFYSMLTKVGFLMTLLQLLISEYKFGLSLNTFKSFLD